MSNQQIPKTQSWQMFNRIAHRYDFLNLVLSLGIDRYWRTILVKKVFQNPIQTIADIATGTGDVAIALSRQSKEASIIGVDLSEKMLEHAQEKCQKKQIPSITLKHGNAMDLPIEDTSVDATTIAFGIRNIPDVDQALREMVRVLKPGGKAYVLEFSLPQNPLIRWGYLVYFRYVLPLIGNWVSGDKQAYSYLNKTVESFPYNDAFATLMKNAGFKNVSYKPLTFGIAALYQGQK